MKDYRFDELILKYNIELQGMIAENEERDTPRESNAYDASNFFDLRRMFSAEMEALKDTISKEPK